MWSGISPFLWTLALSPFEPASAMPDEIGRLRTAAARTLDPPVHTEQHASPAVAQNRAAGAADRIGKAIGGPRLPERRNIACGKGVEDSACRCIDHGHGRVGIDVLGLI